MSPTLMLSVTIISLIIIFSFIWLIIKKKKQYHETNPEDKPYSFQPYSIADSAEHSWADENTKEKFDCVAGMDEIKEELREIGDFLLYPNKYKSFGAKIPKGVLFYGPPGTGKTLLARALANEINAGFIYASGSEFIEKFVGVGAGRIRALFEKAAKKTPCIIFIDEIDAIGITRNTDNNSERDQTLNQLLVELDGFKQYEGIVVIGATNRIDMLDKALLRPGRFDRQIYIGIPSARSREKILIHHLKNKPVENDVNISKLANRTCGFSGAHLANIVNEAALLTIKKEKPKISDEELNEAIIKTVAGLKNKDMILTEREKKLIAWHEAGHAMAEYILNGTIAERITLIPHGQALGFTMSNMKEENMLIGVKEMKNRICILLAGRAAEETVFSEITTGSQNDLKTANEIAESMILNYGMSSNWKNRVYNTQTCVNISKEINDEICSIINESYEKALSLMKNHSYLLDTLSFELLEKETLYQSDLSQLFKAVAI